MKRELKSYIGTKVVKAVPMLLSTYKKNGGVEAHSDLRNSTSGYKVVSQNGYESWCPKYAFEADFRLHENMSFGTALSMIKTGYKIGNKKYWSDKCFIYLQDGAKLSPLDARNKALKSVKFDMQIQSHIDKYVDGDIYVGWTPNQQEMLSDDYYIYEGDEINVNSSI